DLAEFDPGPAAPVGFFAERLGSSADDCRGRSCPYRASCFMQKARAAALTSDLVVTNHAVFFSEPDDEPIALPRAAQVIFDEAHNLEETATDHFALEATPQSLRRLLRRVFTRRAGRKAGGDSSSGALAEAERFLVAGGLPPGGEADRRRLFEVAAAGKEAAAAAQKAVREWCRALGAIPRPDESARRIRPETLSTPAWLAAEPAMMKLQDALFALSKSLQALVAGFLPPADPDAGAPPPPASGREGAEADIARRLAAIDGAIQETLHAIDFIAAADDEGWAYWIESAPAFSQRGEPSGGGRHSAAAEAGLKAAPIDISDYLAKSLFEKRDTVVLCSATLRTGGSMDWMAGRLGLDKLEQGRVAQAVEGSPFDYASQCIAACPMFLPPMNPSSLPGAAESETFVEAFSAMLQRLVGVFGGRTMALFTSHRMLRAVAARLRAGALESAGGGSFRVLAQGEGVPREELTALFREDDVPSVLLGADSFWEGVDFIGDALRCVVLAKLPFASPGEPLVDARGEYVEKNGGSKFRDYAVPGAVIKFRQGFGRLIRHKGDRGAVVVADTRLFDKNYGAIFRKALPVEPTRFDDAESCYAAVAAFSK
ncbi:MAG: ATP-dependent DNA helicase, partial [Kiritimatiellae bacterium]|nr:ATP-dependent DNA helicase [Kiritimatiellia bacterium]